MRDAGAASCRGGVRISTQGQKGRSMSASQIGRTGVRRAKQEMRPHRFNPTNGSTAPTRSLVDRLFFDVFCQEAFGFFWSVA